MSDTQSGTNGAPAEQPKAMVPARQSLAMRDGMVVLRSFEELHRFCQVVCYSGMVPQQYDAMKGDPRAAIGAAMVAIQYGAELGLSPMSSLQTVANINGKPSVYGDGFWALVIGHPDYEDHKEVFDDKTFTWTCSLKRRGKDWKSYSFSRADAETAKLWGKQGPWTNYPKRQCQWRARGFCARDVFPDAFRGVWMAEEARDMVDVQPEWREASTGAGDLPGTVHFAGAGARQPAAHAAETVDPQTGEVKTAPAAEQPKAEPAKPADAGQAGVKF